MDLSFPGFDRNTEVIHLPGDLSVLMVGIAARQTASPTALAQARFGRIGQPSRLLEPLDGAFNGPMAVLLAHWSEEARSEERRSEAEVGRTDE